MDNLGNLDNLDNLDYHKEYLEYKRKYLNLRNELLVDLQVGGNIFSDLFSRSKKNDKQQNENTQQNKLKPVAAWFYNLGNGDFINYNEMLIDSGISTHFMEDTPITRTEYDNYKIGEMTMLLPKQADKYLYVNKEQFNANPEKKKKFLYDYLKYIISKDPKEYGNKKSEEYYVPVRYLILRFEQVANKKEKIEIAKILKDQFNKNNDYNYSEWSNIIDRSIDKSRLSLQPIPAKKWTPALPKQQSEPGGMDKLPELKQPIVRQRPLPSIPIPIITEQLPPSYPAPSSPKKLDKIPTIKPTPAPRLPSSSPSSPRFYRKELPKLPTSAT